MPFDTSGNYYNDGSDVSEYDSDLEESQNPLAANPQLALRNPPATPAQDAYAKTGAALSAQGNVRPSLWRSLLAGGAEFMLGKSHPQAAQVFGDAITQTDPNVRANLNLQRTYQIQGQQAQAERLKQAQERMERQNQALVGQRMQAEQDRLENQRNQRLIQGVKQGFTPARLTADIPAPGALQNPDLPPPLQALSPPTMGAPIPGGGRLPSNAKLPPLAPPGSTPAQFGGQTGYIVPPDVLAKREAAAKGVTISQEDAESAGHPEWSGQTVPASVYNTVIKQGARVKPLDPDTASALIDQVVPPNIKENAALNARTKALVKAHLDNGDQKSAQAAITAAAQEVRQLEVATDPRIKANKISIINETRDIKSQLTPQADKMAKAISEYRMGPLSGFALNRPEGQAIMGRVMELNPEYQATQYPTFLSTEKAFTSGKEATSANALNTMMGHLAVLNQAADALKNGNVQVLNRIANSVGVQFGATPATTYQTIVHRLGPEVTKAYIATGGSVGERGTNEEDFSVNLGHDQIKQNLGISAVLAESKIKALQDQYQRGTYGRGKQSLITPEAQQTMQQLRSVASNRSAPPVGTVEDGHRFKGGDPSKKENWELVKQ